MNPKRILFAGLFHETHTFVANTTELRDFTILRGAEMLRCKGDSSPMGGALEAAAHLSWEVVPTLDVRALPSGTVADDVFESFWSEFQRSAKPALASGLDAIFLVLHGAMVTPSFPDVEGEWLERLRALPGAAALPVFGVFDLHANFTARMARHADCLVAYRENPHADARESARRAVALLERCLAEGRTPRTLWRHPPIVWPPQALTKTSEVRDAGAPTKNEARFFIKASPKHDSCRVYPEYLSAIRRALHLSARARCAASVPV